MALGFSGLTPKEKGILITKAVGGVHERLNHSVNYFYAFISTGIYIPFSHMVPLGDGTYLFVQNSEMDSDMKLQHCEQYEYL